MGSMETFGQREEGIRLPGRLDRANASEKIFTLLRPVEANAYLDEPFFRQAVVGH